MSASLLTADYVNILYSFILSYFHQTVCLLLFAANKRGRYTEWSQFVADYFVRQSDLLHWRF